MNKATDTLQNIHIYKPKRGTLAQNFFALVLMGIVFGIPFTIFVLMLVSLIRAGSNLEPSMTIMACFITPIAILLGFNLLQMTFGVIASFFSYIKVTPDGIEQKHSPYMHIRCNWSDVDKLGKFFSFTDVIYLNSYEVLSFSISLKFPFRFFRPKQGFISLSGYEGWPKGQLTDDLKQYAPKLFDDQPTPLAMQSTSSKETEGGETQPKTTSASKEHRLLAAISHAAVLFSYISVLVPVGIYLTQRKKSAYLGFHSMQAFTLQITKFVFSLLASSCMVGSIFIPFLLSTAAQNENHFGLAGGGIYIVAIISVFLMIIGNLGFIIYGIIGAVMTYQGKDFRYIIIGNLIDRKLRN